MSGRHPRGWLDWYSVLYFVVVGILGIALAAGVICFFDGPMLAPSDPGVYAFTGYYFAKNLSLFPVPRIELETDWSLYPYGIDHVFLHWSFEREYIYALMTGLFGNGPWFQLYFLASILSTAVGTFLVLRSEHGTLRASIVGLAISFGNFYIIRKFPLHLPYTTVHWTVLGILVDYVVVRRWFANRPIRFGLITVRFILLVLSLGLDPGYVAGYSLTSFVLSVVWIAINATRRIS